MSTLDTLLNPVSRQSINKEILRSASNSSSVSSDNQREVIKSFNLAKQVSMSSLELPREVSSRSVMEMQVGKLMTHVS